MKFKYPVSDENFDASSLSCMCCCLCANKSEPDKWVYPVGQTLDEIISLDHYLRKSGIEADSGLYLSEYSNNQNENRALVFLTAKEGRTKSNT